MVGLAVLKLRLLNIAPSRVGRFGGGLLPNVYIARKKSLQIRVVIKSTATTLVGILTIGTGLKATIATFGKAAKRLLTRYFGRIQSLGNGERWFLRGTITPARYAVRDVVKETVSKSTRTISGQSLAIRSWFTIFLTAEHFAPLATGIPLLLAGSSAGKRYEKFIEAKDGKKT